MKPLEGRKVICCVGSGGVGKTTTAAALALRAAMEENRDWFDRLLFGPVTTGVASKSRR